MRIHTKVITHHDPDEFAEQYTTAINHAASTKVVNTPVDVYFSTAAVGGVIHYSALITWREHG